jgi:transposase, IS30 family
MTHRQLTLEERYHIEAYVDQGWSQAEVARVLGRDASTISRELRRNGSPSLRYTAFSAAKRVHQRRVDKGERSQKVRGQLKKLVEQKLRMSWSPEQISGRLWLESGIHLSHETIYQHVLRDSRRQGFLRYCLRFGGYKHHRFKKSRAGERTRQRKHWIEQRPAAANERSEIGHWERDCIVGRHGGSVLLTMVDRKSRFTRIRQVLRHQAKEVGAATVAALAAHRSVTKTMTNDNGSEFQRDEPLERQLGVPIYYTEPSSPWQRGSIENLNGLVRQYVPKGTNLDKLPPLTARALEETLNYRPRKTLGYRTPQEIFYAKENALMRGPLLRLGLEFSGSA